MEVHSRPLTEERPILFRAHFSLLKNLGNHFHRSVIPLSLYGNARFPPPLPSPHPLAKLIRILEAGLPETERHMDESACTKRPLCNEWIFVVLGTSRLRHFTQNVLPVPRLPPQRWH